MSLFKKRKVSTGGRKQATEQDVNAEEETKISKVDTKTSLIAVTTKTAKSDAVQHKFASSGSAVASGKVDQGATIDTSNDIGSRISGSRAGYACRLSFYNVAYSERPVKHSSNLRISCRFDYQPNVCKDYKDSGYCGYGDSCVFLHDRY
jgi:RING finger protein 113A